MNRTIVVLVNYNGSEDTAKCLRSLYTSVDMPHIVVVDNTPNDPELAVAMAEFPKVHLIFSSHNLGFGEGNNLGINWAMSQSGWEFLFILNNDTTVLPDSIRRLEATLNAYPSIGMVAPRVVFMDRPDVLWYGGGEVSWFRGGAVQPGILGSSTAPLAMHAREVSFASGCAMLLRRKLIQQLVGFDKRFFMYEEDLELCLRTHEIGWGIRYEPSALVLHKVQASSRGDQGFVGMLSPFNKNLAFYAYHVVRNRLINMRLHAKGFNRIKFFVGFFLLMSKKSIHFLIHKRFDGINAIFKGWQSYRKSVANPINDFSEHK
jgi:GT2 family glycosyltransferase